MCTPRYRTILGCILVVMAVETFNYTSIMRQRYLLCFLCRDVNRNSVLHLAASVGSTHIVDTLLKLSG